MGAVRMTQTKGTPDITVRCGTCDGENVRRDAYAEWNVELQQWELATVFDQAVCEACGCECSLIEKEIK